MPKKGAIHTIAGIYSPSLWRSAEETVSHRVHALAELIDRLVLPLGVPTIGKPHSELLQLVVELEEPNGVRIETHVADFVLQLVVLHHHVERAHLSSFCSICCILSTIVALCYNIVYYHRYVPKKGDMQFLAHPLVMSGEISCYITSCSDDPGCSGSGAAWHPWPTSPAPLQPVGSSGS